ncbi:MAG: hypothetical protein SF028_00050 [Candidatus Sumerlaeia bacterium]|nr:hypothetical protein [Candidatus Sumerlaeia bacterium]
MLHALVALVGITFTAPLSLELAPPPGGPAAAAAIYEAIAPMPHDTVFDYEVLVESSGQPAAREAHRVALGERDTVLLRETGNSTLAIVYRDSELIAAVQGSQMVLRPDRYVYSQFVPPFCSVGEWVPMKSMQTRKAMLEAVGTSNAAAVANQVGAWLIPNPRYGVSLNDGELYVGDAELVQLSPDGSMVLTHALGTAYLWNDGTTVFDPSVSMRIEGDPRTVGSTVAVTEYTEAEIPEDATPAVVRDVLVGRTPLPASTRTYRLLSTAPMAEAHFPVTLDGWAEQAAVVTEGAYENPARRVFAEVQRDGKSELVRELVFDPAKIDFVKAR